MHESAMALENKRYWERPECAEDYASKRGFFAGEEAALAECDPILRGGDVLEIGVGGGRMAEHLHRLARRYVGVDYSTAMIDASRARFPDLDLRVCDARDLSMFADASFDAVCMFGSAIDDVAPVEREIVMAEVRRVLLPGGVFLFSSHNLDTTFEPAWAPRRIRRGARYMRGLLNRTRNRRREVHGDDWAVINDQTNDFGVLTFYIRKERQLRLLAESGFHDVVMFSLTDGRSLAAGDVCRDYAIYYAARRI